MVDITKIPKNVREEIETLPSASLRRELKRAIDAIFKARIYIVHKGYVLAEKASIPYSVENQVAGDRLKKISNYLDKVTNEIREYEHRKNLENTEKFIRYGNIEIQRVVEKLHQYQKK